ncbi:MAG: hypothetical protein U0441_04040 [Polyangiaceae bacterium]
MDVRLTLAGWDARTKAAASISLSPEALEKAVSTIASDPGTGRDTSKNELGTVRGPGASDRRVPQRFRPPGALNTNPRTAVRAPGRRDPPPRILAAHNERGAVRDPLDPRTARWAVVVLEDDAAAAKSALADLLSHRIDAGVAFDKHAMIGGEKGILRMSRPSSENPDRWFERATEAAGGKLPPYLLFVGGPERFPFDVVERFDREHATGRLDLGDTPDGPFSWDACAAYAKKVVEFETGNLPVEPQALLYAFGTDEATRRSRDEMILPLRKTIEDGTLVRRPGLGPVSAKTLFDAEATTENLFKTLSTARPAVVLAATHGLEFPANRADWGALTDQSFVGAGGGQALSAASVLANGQAPFAPGAVMFSFACYSGGVPKKSAITFLEKSTDTDLPDAPFVPALPRALLAAKNGPVAFVGHVDRATSESFAWADDGPGAFVDFIEWTCGGNGTLGQAMRSLRESVAAASLDLAAALTPALGGKRRGTPERILRAWIRYHDMRGYLLLGDPWVEPRCGLVSAR